MVPLSIYDLSNAGMALEHEQCLCQGFMPGLHDTARGAKNLQNHFSTYMEKDACNAPSLVKRWHYKVIPEYSRAMRLFLLICDLLCK